MSTRSAARASRSRAETRSGPGLERVRAGFPVHVIDLEWTDDRHDQLHGITPRRPAVDNEKSRGQAAGCSCRRPSLTASYFPAEARLLQLCFTRRLDTA